LLVTRFRQEALAAAAIRHQNIIAVTDFGVVRSMMPFLVMEYVSGKSLHDMLLEEGALPPARALEIMSAIGAGVAAAHRQGIIHRDLKPLNVMFQEGLPVAEAVKVLDFGLAKIKSGELLGSFVQAKTSGLMGSPFYMAPEQWGDEEPDARADIYSLGVILYQMLAGDVPFKGNNIPSIMKKHLTEAPPSFASRGVTVPTQIETVVPHMLRGTHRIQILHDGYAEWVQQVECSGGMCDVEARLQNLTETSVPPASVAGQQSLSNPYAGTISGSLIDEPVLQESQSAMEAKRLRQQTEALEEQARQEDEARRREQERLEQEERARLAREQAEREEQARRKAEEEEARLKAEAEARRVAEESARQQAEAARLRTEEEAR